MDRAYVNRDILDWMLGYYIFLVCMTASLIIPLLVLVPLFFIWRAVNLKKVDFDQRLTDKEISKLSVLKKRIPLSLIFFGSFIVLIFLYIIYKVYLEYYWFTYIAVPCSSFLGDISAPLFDMIFGLIGSLLKVVFDIVGSVLSAIGKFIDSVFSLLFFFLEDAYEWGIKVTIPYELGYTDSSFSYFLAQYIITPLYKFFFMFGDTVNSIGVFLKSAGNIINAFFHNLVSLFEVGHHMWIGHTKNISIEYHANMTKSFFERIKFFLIGV